MALIGSVLSSMVVSTLFSQVLEMEKPFMEALSFLFSSPVCNLKIFKGLFSGHWHSSYALICFILGYNNAIAMLHKDRWKKSYKGTGKQNPLVMCISALFSFLRENNWRLTFILSS